MLYISQLMIYNIYNIYIYIHVLCMYDYVCINYTYTCAMVITWYVGFGHPSNNGNPHSGPPGFRLLDGLLSTGGHFLPYGALASVDDWVDRWLPMKYHMNPYDSGGFIKAMVVQWELNGL